MEIICAALVFIRAFARVGLKDMWLPNLKLHCEKYQALHTFISLLSVKPEFQTCNPNLHTLNQGFSPLAGQKFAIN